MMEKTKKNGTKREGDKIENITVYGVIRVTSGYGS